MVTVIYRNGNRKFLNDFNNLPKKGGLYAYDEDDFFYAKLSGEWIQDERRNWSFLVSPDSPYSIRRKSDNSWWTIFDEFCHPDDPGLCIEADFVSVEDAKVCIDWHKLADVEIVKNHTKDVMPNPCA